MIDFYEQTFGLPYPWDRYAQVLVRKLDAGGMENTAATFIRESTFTEQPSPGPGSLDGLIAHELAHQWFGNLITCRSWSHLWLNEGLATYAEALWREHAETPEAYLAEVRAATRSLIAKDTAPAPQAPALVSHVYTNPDDRFGIAANPYSKGMMILHMLRRKIGDGPFFAGLRTYARTHADGTVETADLRRAFEASSGVSLERFFDQWTLRPGVPRLRVEASWNPATQTLSVECDQTQHIDRLNPAYALDVPIHILFEDGTVRVVTLTTDSEKISAKFVVSEGAASNPVSCEFDPQVHALASILPRAIDLRTGAVLPDWEREPEPVLLGSPDDANAEMQPAQIPADEPTPTQP
jgi:aminopeptidase N